MNKTTPQTVAYFWSETCNPCKQFEKIFDVVCQQFPNIKTIKINVEKHDELVQQYNIFSVPTMIFFGNGVPLETHVGTRTVKELIQIIKENFKLK